MHFAYADPPYPGLAKMFYGKHEDYAGEVDHQQLITSLCDKYPDGWALSTSSSALPFVLSLCPGDIRLAIWHVTNSQPLGNPAGRYAWHRSWEPVIFRGGRKGTTPVRDVLSCGAPHSGKGTFPGAKPAAFCRWVFELLGALPGDELDDLFPGSGAVGRAWSEHVQRPPQLPAGPDLSRTRPELVMRRLGAATLDGQAGVDPEHPGRWKSRGQWVTR